MNAIGGQEILLGSLQNKEIWENTDRWDDEKVDVWFKTKLKSGVEVGLAFSHEEALVNILNKEVKSHKDLPIYAYQFQTKFRNELRAKGGLLRTREFIMKDMYSFDKNEADFDVFYEKAKAAYSRIFDRVGIGEKTFLTFASGGSFSKYSHEFQTICDAGEDTIYLSRLKNIAVNKEVFEDEVLNNLGLDKATLEELKAVEVGNIFPLKTKYADAGNLKFTDTEGKEQPVVMGCYGIGPARVLATVVEINNDEKGIVWPKSIAPARVHLVGLNLEQEDVRIKAFALYGKLQTQNIEVLFDDRVDVSAGEKFADADLIGIPVRAVVSKKSGDLIEVKERNKEEGELVGFDELLIKILS
jgi:prolyl-tRNA synthetase